MSAPLLPPIFPPVSNPRGQPPQPQPQPTLQSEQPFDQESSATEKYSAATPSSLTYRQLNVKDALTYLDNIKARTLLDRLDIYNGFLDIMKDFKNSMYNTTPDVLIIELTRKTSLP
jgi:paired amphipathic helix protein Sin3a